MNVLLVNPPWETDKGYGIRSNSRWPHVRPDKHLQFPIYLAYSATLLEQSGHKVRVLDAVAEELTADSFLQYVLQSPPDIVFMETATPSFKQDLQNAKDLKKAGLPVYLFGTHTTVFYKDILKENPGIDGLIRGEFEYVILDIVKGVPKEEVKGLAYWDALSNELRVNPDAPLIENLDSLPFPSRHLFNLDHYKIHLDPFPNALLVASRGCPFQCTYCIWPQTMYGHKHRRRSPENICDEIEMLIRDYGIIFFRFDDDIFALNPKAVIEFCEEFLRRGLEKKLTWTCFGHVNACNEEMFRIMARANCCRIDFGIESGSQRILDVMKKNISIDKAKKTFELCRNYNIRTYADFMIGFPYENREEIKRSIETALFLDPDYIQVSYVIPIPGTEMYFEGIKKGFIDSGLPFEQYDSTGQIINTGDISEEELKMLYNKFWKRFYLRPKFILREIRRAVSSKKELSRVIRGGISFYKRVYGKKSFRIIVL